MLACYRLPFGSGFYGPQWPGFHDTLIQSLFPTFPNNEISYLRLLDRLLFKLKFYQLLIIPFSVISITDMTALITLSAGTAVPASPSFPFCCSIPHAFKYDG